MGRLISAERHQRLIQGWQRQLLAVSWGSSEPDTGLTRLASVIGINLSGIGDEPRRRLKSALTALRSACGGVGGDHRLQSPAALDAWITRHLVAAGDDLLIPDERRRGLLARLRDQDRQRSHTERGLRSVRIELPADSWKKLKRIGAQSGTTTLAATLMRLIEAHPCDEKPLGGAKSAGTDGKAREINQMSFLGFGAGATHSPKPRAHRRGRQLAP